MKRKPIPKEVRQKVYDKYDGHCAYCGCELDMKSMQVDHIESVYFAELAHKEVNDTLDNYMPACRACNFYKGAGGIEHLRWWIKHTLEKTCVQTFQSKLAMKYGILEFKPWDEKFYFEKENIQ